MPFVFNPINRIILSFFAAMAVFLVLTEVFAVERLIILLNGAFAGTFAAILISYGRLLYNAALGRKPYDRVQQMTIGFFLCWFAYVLTVLVSIYYRASGEDVSASFIVAFSRYIAILAAILQVTAPDFGLGMLHGRDRKILVIGVLAGLAVAGFMIATQEAQSLAEQLPLARQIGLQGAIGTAVGVSLR